MPLDAAATQAMNEPPVDPEAFDENDADFGDKIEETPAEVVEDKPTEAPAEEAEKEASEEASEDEKGEESEPEPEPKPHNNGIPRHRFNYAQQKRREAEQALREREEELERLRAEQAKSNEPSREQLMAAADQRINALDKEIEEARADNDRDKVTELRAEQRKYERYLAKMELQPAETIDPQAVTQQAVEEIRVTQTITQLEAAYPMLQEGNEAFNEDLSDEVMDTFDSFATRMPKDEALQRAVAYVTAAHGIQPAGASTPTQRSTKTDVKKNLKAAAAQPPELDRTGLDSDKGGVSRRIDIEHMSQEDFEKLGDKELDELLGNYDV